MLTLTLTRGCSSHAAVLQINTCQRPLEQCLQARSVGLFCNEQSPSFFGLELGCCPEAQSAAAQEGFCSSRTLMLEHKRHCLPACAPADWSSTLHLGQTLSSCMACGHIHKDQQATKHHRRLVCRRSPQFSRYYGCLSGCGNSM